LPLGKKHLQPEEIKEKECSLKNDEKESFLQPGILDAAMDIECAVEEKKSLIQDSDYNMSVEDGNLEKEKNIILVVEDSADLRYYIRTSLEPFFLVEEAANGREGIEKAKTIIPDLIISDIMMPGIDGYELCRIIKNDISTSHIPVVMLTAKASEENIIQGYETGADDYITKPFNTRLLGARIKNLIELRRQLQLNVNREMAFQPSSIKVSKIDREFLDDLQKVIEKNLSNPDLNVEDLSKRLYMSRTTLYRKILALTGEPPTDFIRTCRLKKAAQMLKNNYGSVTEVAFEVGFNSRAYFTKCFREKFHRLPSDYFISESSES
jgi:DNA-binding response OmpR family regulator